MGYQGSRIPSAGRDTPARRRKHLVSTTARKVERRSKHRDDRCVEQRGRDGGVTSNALRPEEKPNVTGMDYGPYGDARPNDDKDNLRVNISKLKADVVDR